MRKLTLPGFLSAYVRSLSECKLLNVHKLVQEIYNGNDRLREPLFMYCYYNDKSKLLLRYLSENDALEFVSIGLKLTNEEYSSLPRDYLKVINSYECKLKLKDNESRIKELMLDKIIKLRDEKAVTNYRIYTDLKINGGNFNDFVKNRNVNKLSVDKSREVYNYLRSL